MTTPSESETARVEAIYDRIAPEWDKRQGCAERILIGGSMRSALAVALRGDVLEIAAGTGVTLRNLAGNQAVTSYTGVDLSAGMLAQARKAAPELPFPVDLRQMDATRLDFPDASFDTVTVSLSLCTVPDPAGTLREMARVCRPDGRIVLLEHVLSPNRFVAWWQHRLAPAQHRMLGCHLDRQTDRLVRDLGFKVERDQSRLFGIFHLIIAHPPVEKRGSRK
jgi:ubiquinone/menaquinone biosynthesis C-methylase UbiE